MSDGVVASTRRVVVYDLDGTLVAGDIGKSFLEHLMRDSLWRLIVAGVSMPILMPMLKINRTRRFAVSSFLWIGSVGRAGRIAAMAQAFAREHTMDILPTATARLRRDLEGDDHIVVATGAWEELAAVLIERLGLSRTPVLVASRTRAFLGGLVVGRQCNSFEKIRVLRGEGITPPFDEAITDAWMDWPLLHEARLPVLVTHSRSLADRMRTQIGDRLEVLPP